MMISAGYKLVYEVKNQYLQVLIAMMSFCDPLRRPKRKTNSHIVYAYAELKSSRGLDSKVSVLVPLLLRIRKFGLMATVQVL